MCRSMADIRSTVAEIRRGKKRWKKEGKKLQGKNIMAPLLHRAAIISPASIFVSVSTVPGRTNARVFAVQRCQYRRLRVRGACDGLASARSARRLPAASPCDAAVLIKRDPKSRDARFWLVLLKSDERFLKPTDSSLSLMN